MQGEDELVKVLWGGGLSAVLPGDSSLWPLLFELAGGFLMLVPIRYKPGEHRVVKIESIAPFRFRQRGLGGFARSALASVGFLPRSFSFADRPIGWAQGTHFEFSAPEELLLAKGRLSVRQHDPEMGDIEIERRRVSHGRARMDLNVSVRDPDAPLLAREDAADVHLDLRPRVGGGYVAIVLAAIASSALLATVAGRLAEIEEQTSAAVLLLVPALLVTYLVRPGEHAIATRMLAGVRVLGLLGAVAAFAGAALIGVTEVRTTSSSPTTERIDCTPVTERIGPGAAGRTALRDLDCSLVRPPAPVRRASADAANRLRALVWVAGIAAGVLAAGWLCAAVATWRARRRRDESHPNPPTVEVL